LQKQSRYHENYDPWENQVATISISISEVLSSKDKSFIRCNLEINFYGNCSIKVTKIKDTLSGQRPFQKYI
jgi:hypothetical protein